MKQYINKLRVFATNGIAVFYKWLQSFTIEQERWLIVFASLLIPACFLDSLVAGNTEITSLYSSLLFWIILLLVNFIQHAGEYKTINMIMIGFCGLFVGANAVLLTIAIITSF